GEISFDENGLELEANDENVCPTTSADKDNVAKVDTNEGVSGMDRREASSLPTLRKRLVLKELEIAEVRLEKKKNCCSSSVPIMRNVLESNFFIRISDCVTFVVKLFCCFLLCWC
ncbi:hypothetical protein OESDEN_21264, partial [Oesophagostomum dentatum]